MGAILVKHEPPVTVEELAQRLGVATQTVRNWARRGVLPAPWKLSGRILRWDREVIERWLSRREGGT
jgi:excisionase family DNA binding protein